MGICFTPPVSVIGALLCSLVDAITTAGTGKLGQERIVGMVNQSDKR